ncbi:zinc-finger associated domain containing protein [Oryctes borbonicus]|uniref:Zinc-finger associated domain containing protein n=1 Tax=Oryctes borbonicus TaxID=1629725 RepID=A0A0T6B6Y1_9SCAR|nr:zinc-finger associated domain containing protein [Oryctes borbonicus]
MATVDTTRYSDLCRLCGIKTGDVLGINIFADEGIVRQIYKKIEICLPVQIHESDELPKMICKQCLVKLDCFIDFREKTIRTENLLIDLYKELSSVGLQNDQMKMNIVFDYPEYLMVQHHHLINENIQNVSEIDLNQLGHRENMVIEHQIILGPQPVEINGHSLDNIDLSQHELANQDISNHSLQTQDATFVDDNSGSHMIQTSRFTTTNLELINQEHQLTSYTTEGYELNEIDLSDDSVQVKETQIMQQNHELGNTQILNGTSSENKGDLQCESEDKQYTLEIESNNVVKHEDSNTGNHLSADEKRHTNQNKLEAVTCETVQNVSDASPVSDTELCKLCGKIIDKSMIQQHFDQHFMKCIVCLALFSNKSALDNHSKEVHGASPEEIKNNIKERLKRDGNVTSDQSESDDDSTELSNIRDEDEPFMITELNGNKIKKWTPKICKECGKIYKTNYKLTEHMRKHTGEKPYKCGSCDKAFRSKIGLAQHEAKHTGQYDFACPVCGKGFQCKSYLMVHQRVHSDVKPYPCTTCGQNFKSKQSLMDHTNRHLGVKPYICDICGRGFITKGLCRAHQKVHTGLDNRKYSCLVCNKRFVSKSYLQTHMRIHTGEKPFMCEVCGKGFLTRVDLRIHSTMHTGEKSYVCEMCGKAFARRDALRCHRRSHTGERPYSCDQCGQTFTQFSPMAIHKRLHTGERPYSCEECGKKFVSKSTLMAHSKKHDITKKEK